MIFLLLFLVLIVLTALGVYCLSREIRKYQKIKDLNRRGVIISWGAPILFLGVVTLIFGIFNAFIIFFHILTALFLIKLVGLISKKAFNKKVKPIICHISAFSLVVVYLGFGWFFAHKVFETNYDIETQKELGQEKFRIAQIADSHLGVTLDGEKFSREIDKIQNLNPDILVVTGDFVDDDSSKEDMIKACEALGNIKTTYGVYFVFGNHDEGYYDGRDFGFNDLRNQLLKNGVKILEDESVLINQNIYLVGRKDKSYKDRLDMETLVSPLDNTKYMIVLDHQPNDYDAEIKAEVDLVLSGHTHGGHIFPAGILGLLMGANDKVYGYEKIENTNFVVTSGISGWGIPFKTGAISEYVIIDIYR